MIRTQFTRQGIRQFTDAQDINPGMIIIPFIGADRFNVERVEITTWGAVKVINWYGEVLEMSTNNAVEILGYYNPEN